MFIKIAIINNTVPAFEIGELIFMVLDGVNAGIISLMISKNLMSSWLKSCLKYVLYQ